MIRGNIFIVHRIIFFVCLIFCQGVLFSQDNNWPQFRGPNCSGIASTQAKPPIELDQRNLLWKATLPVGHSSLVIWGDNIFVTGFIKANYELQTLCINRKDGSVKWSQSIFPESIENYHAVGNAAQTSAVTDGERVCVYFGSYGLLCYDMEGRLLWEMPMPVHDHAYGAGSSPIIHGNLLILCRDVNDRRLLALDKFNGQVVWSVEMPEIESTPQKTTFGTPAVYKEYLILHRAGEISAYSLLDGRRVRWFPIITGGVSTPIAHQNTVYVGAWYNLSEKATRPELPEYANLVSANDVDKDGLISQDEVPEDLLFFDRPEIADFDDARGEVKRLFGMFDGDENGEINQQEWEGTVSWIKSFYKEAGLLAINPRGNEELSLADVRWTVSDKVPEVPSPIYYSGRVYMCKNGGILTCVDAEKGNIIYRDRIGVSGPYFASPVIANGHLYISSGNGVVTVIKAGDKMNIVAKNDLNEKIFATPAIFGNTIYIRTNQQLYAFGQN
jgi:outer membrane protein assembly factor BamB